MSPLLSSLLKPPLPFVTPNRTLPLLIPTEQTQAICIYIFSFVLQGICVLWSIWRGWSKDIFLGNVSASFCFFVYSFLPVQRLKWKNVSDLNIVGMRGENEKQMLDPYAGAVSSFWHTNTLPRIRQGVGGSKRETGEGQTQTSVCVCVFESAKNMGMWAF